MKQSNQQGNETIILERSLSESRKGFFVLTGRIASDSIPHISVSTTFVDVKITIHNHPWMDIRMTSFSGGPELSATRHGDRVELNVETPSKRSVFQHKKEAQCQLELTVPPDISEHWEIACGSGKVICRDLLAHTITCKGGSGDYYCDALRVQHLHAAVQSGSMQLKHIYGAITGKVSSGDVNVVAYRGDHLYLKATSGEIYIEDAIAEKSVLEVTSGDIEVKGLTVDNAVLAITSGDARISDFSGSLHGSATSGDLRIVSKGDAALNLEVGSGDLTVALDRDTADATIEVSKRSGQFITNLPLKITANNSHHIHGIVGEGKNPVQLRTGSGDIVLNWKR